MASEPYQNYAVLYVDDEPQSLKYMEKALRQDIPVLTAPSAEEGRRLLEQDDGRVAVLIADQRMPAETGVELLSEVRAQRPNVVRILTTAYSDLSSAIEAVNSGAIFRYISKPWDIRELRGAILRAVDFHIAQKERDTLLREKLSVLQRLLVMDRVRSYAVLAAGVAYRLRNSMNALKTFLELAPAQMREPAQGTSPHWVDLWTLARDESRRVLETVQEIVQQTADTTYSFQDHVAVGELVEEAVGRWKARGTGDTPSLAHVEDPGPIRTDASMIHRLLDILVEQAMSLNQPGERTEIHAEPTESVWGAPGVRLRLRSTAEEWSTKQVSQLFNIVFPSVEQEQETVGTGFLTAFFIAYHHGGDLRIYRQRPSGPGFEVLLPLDPENVPERPVETDWLEHLFVHFDEWDPIGGP